MGYARRTYLVPLPQGENLEAINEQVAEFGYVRNINRGCICHTCGDDNTLPIACKRDTFALPCLK